MVMGRIRLNEVLCKINSDSSANDEVVKDLLMLTKGKCPGSIGRVKCKKASSTNESFGDSLERWYGNMSLIDSIKNTLVEHVITIATVREMQVSKNVNLEKAVEILGKEIENALQDRFQSNNWLGWLKSFEKGKSVTQEILDRFNEIAVESYKRGYLDGFSDREKLSAKCQCSEIKGE